MRRNLPEQDARSGILYMSMSMTIAVCCVAARRVHAQIDFGLDRQMTSGTKHFCKCSDATRWGSACGWRIQQKRQNRCRERERIWTTTPNAHVSALYCRWIFLKNIFFFVFSVFILSMFRQFVAAPSALSHVWRNPIQHFFVCFISFWLSHSCWQYKYIFFPLLALLIHFTFYSMDIFFFIRSGCCCCFPCCWINT